MKQLTEFHTRLTKVFKSQMHIWKCIYKLDLDTEILECISITYSVEGSTPIMYRKAETKMHFIIYNLLKEYKIDYFRFSYSKKENKKIIILSF